MIDKNLMPENIVWVDDLKQHATVIEVWKSAVLFETAKTGLYNRPYSGLRGIELTPELLEKVGFVESKSDDNDERKLYSIQVGNNTSLYFDEGNSKNWYLSHEWNNNHFQNDFWSSPKYLHTLQNLFFALTGSKLEVNF